MYQGHRIGVVVPIYNEAAFVGEVLDGLPAYVDRVYPVDDCSTDGTWAVLEERATTEARVDEGDVEASPRTVETTPDGGRAIGPEIVPIRHGRNRGRGGAVKTGYAAALADDMDIVAVMDGDGQMDPSLLHTLLDPIVAGDAEYAKGNRLATPELRDQMSSWRLFGNTVLTYLTRVASGYWGMTDPQNGYTAIASETLRRLDVDDLYDDYGFLNDVLVRLNVRGARIVDVPTPAVYGDEESGIEYRSFVPMLLLLLVTRFFWRLRSNYAAFTLHPVAILYGLAASVGVAGAGNAVRSVLFDDQGIGGAVTLVAILCPVFVVVAFLVERRYNSDLEFDPDSDFPTND